MTVLPGETNGGSVAMVLLVDLGVEGAPMEESVDEVIDHIFAQHAKD
jgi:hypothetical protein